MTIWSFPVFAVFIVAFLIGPGLFAILLRSRPTDRALRLLAIAAMVLALLGTGSSLLSSGMFGYALWPLAVMLGLLWAAWIAGLALTAQALRRRFPGETTRLFTLIGGALVSTAPWFGLAASGLVIL